MTISGFSSHHIYLHFQESLLSLHKSQMGETVPEALTNGRTRDTGHNLFLCRPSQTSKYISFQISSDFYLYKLQKRNRKEEYDNYKTSRRLIERFLLWMSNSHFLQCQLPFSPFFFNVHIIQYVRVFTNTLFLWPSQFDQK